MAQKTALPTNLTTHHVRRVRATRVIQRQIDGYTKDQIAQELGISKTTVDGDIKFAKQNGLLDKVETQVLSQLAPLAVEVYRKKLVEDEDAFVAKDVLSLITKLGDRRAKTEQVSQSFTIEDYIRSRQNPVKEISEQPVEVKALPGEVINENGTDSGE